MSVPTHERFEIWEDPNSIFPLYPWRARLTNYTAYFQTRDKAEAFTKEVIAYRLKYELDGVKKKSK